MTDIITMPDELYRNTLVRFNPTHINTSSQASAFNPFGRTDGPSAIFWQVEMNFQVSERETYLAFRRFVMKLKGGKVLARLYDLQMVAHVMGSQPRGAGGVGSVVNIEADGAAGDETVTLRNLKPNESVALMYGDQIGIGENLYPVLDNVASDAGGLATVALGIPLRMGVAEGDAVNLVKPTGLFRLVAGGDQLAMSMEHIGQAFSLSFIEEPAFA